MKLDLFKQLKKSKRVALKKKIIKMFFLSILIIVLIIVGLKAIISTISKMSYFDVTNVILENSPLTTKEVAQYCDIDLPVNIFTIDLGQTATNIQILHPELKKVIIKRQLPDTLLVEIKRRKPIVEIEIDNKYYRIDKNGFVLPGFLKTSNPELPDITGIRSSLILKSLSRVCESGRLRDALEILKILKQTGIFEKYRITKIDVSNYRNPAFTINGKIEVKINREGLKEKIKALSESLPSIKLDEVKYIDLRFEDVIIGTK